MSSKDDEYFGKQASDHPVYGSAWPEAKNDVLVVSQDTKVNCCGKPGKACACMTKTNWIYCNLICSAITLLLGGLLWVMLSPIMVNVIKQLVLVSSPDSLMYESFEQTWLSCSTPACDGEDDPALPPVPYYEAFFFFNITNVDEVLNGALPSVTEVGPWIYRTNSIRFNILFNDDSTAINFTNSKTYYFQPDMSIDAVTGEFLSEDALITVVNPGYLGALFLGMNEALVEMALIGPVTYNLVQDILTYYINGYLIDQEGYTEQEVLQMCNALAVPAGDSCQTLEDAAIVQWGYYEYSFGPFNPIPDLEYGLDGDQVADIPELQQYFPWQAEFGSFGYASVNLTTINSTEGIAAYTGAIFPTAFKSLLFNVPHGLKYDPIALVDFAVAALSRDVESLQTNWGVTWQQADAFFSYTASRTGSNSGIRATYVSQLFNECLDTGSGLYATKTAKEWLFTASDPLLEYLFPASPWVLFIGNATDRNASDPLYPGEPSPNSIYADFFAQGTGTKDIADTFEMHNYKGFTEMDWFESGVKVPVRGNSALGTFPLTPVSSSGKIPSQLPDIWAWSPDHVGSVRFWDTGIIENKPTTEYILEYAAKFNKSINPDDIPRIPSHRFDLAIDTYDVDKNKDLYDDRFTGFVNSTYKDMAPLMMCQPHFLWVPAPWINNLTGIRAPNETLDSTYFNLEPMTGLGLEGLLQLQANFYLKGSTGVPFFPSGTIDLLDILYPFLPDPSAVPTDVIPSSAPEVGLQITFYSRFSNVTLDVMYATFYVQQISKVTPELAGIVNISIVASKIITGLWISLMTIGALFVVIHTARLIQDKKHSQAGYYHPINN